MANELLIPNMLDAYNKGAAVGQQNRFNKLAGQAYAAPEADRNALLTQAVSIDPSAGLKLGDTLQDRDDSTLKRAVGAARYVKQALDTKNPQQIQGAYMAVRPYLAKLGAETGKVPPEAWSDDMIPQLHQLLAMGEGGSSGNIQSTFVNDQGQKIGVMRDGSKVVLGMAENLLQLRDQPGIAPGAFDRRQGTLSPVREAGAPAPAAGANLGSPMGAPSGNYQDVFADIAARNGSVVTSGQRPVIPGVGAGVNSQHPAGTAADFRTNDLSPEQVQALMNDLRSQGFEVIDERDNRNGRGPHIHAELPPGARAPVQAATGAAAMRPATTAAEQERLGLAREANERAKEAANIAAYQRQLGNAPDGFRFTQAGNLEPIPGGPKPAGTVATEGERKAATLLRRLDGSLSQLNTAVGEDASASSPSVIAELGRSLPFVGETAANVLNSPERQRVEAAQLDILDAALTLGTGAAYTKEQLQGYRRAFFPQVGDDSTTVKDKSDRLQNVIQAARIAAGRAAPAADQGAPSAMRQPSAPAQYNVGQVIEANGKRYRVTGGDPSDPEVEEVP